MVFQAHLLVTTGHPREENRNTTKMIAPIFLAALVIGAYDFGVSFFYWLTWTEVYLSPPLTLLILAWISVGLSGVVWFLSYFFADGSGKYGSWLNFYTVHFFTSMILDLFFAAIPITVWYHVHNTTIGGTPDYSLNPQEYNFYINCAQQATVGAIIVVVNVCWLFKNTQVGTAVSNLTAMARPPAQQMNNKFGQNQQMRRP